MINFFKITFFILFSVSCGAQIKYEKAYFINNVDERVDCIIKNTDWLNNPTEFNYKLTEKGDVKKETINSIKEFGFVNGYKYIRANVNIDKSREEMAHLSHKRRPEYKAETLFLKELMRGEAVLFLYRESGLTRFFYEVGGKEIKQLVYKPYNKEDEGVTKIAYNEQYKQQLFLDLKCSKVNLEPEYVHYKESDLLSFFEKYNNCENSDFVNYSKKNNEKKDLYNLSIRIGGRSSSFSYIRGGRIIDFETNFGFRLGVENEFIFNFNKNKWSFVAEPLYQQFSSTLDVSTQTSLSREALIDYKTLELPLSLRHSFYINEKSRIYINAGYVLVFPINSKFSYAGGDIDVVKTTNWVYGIGYNYDKFSVELRGASTRGIFQFAPSKYESVSFILGYEIF